MSWRVALMWGTVIVSVLLGGARRRLPSDPNFCAWLNRLPAIPISHQQDRYFVSEASFSLGPLEMLVRSIHQVLNGM